MHAYQARRGKFRDREKNKESLGRKTRGGEEEEENKEIGKRNND